MAGFTDIFKDKLDTALDLALLDRFGEVTGERSEGPTELGNPQVVTQPVRQSQTPGGQPLNVPLSFIQRNQGTLLIVFGALLSAGVLFLLLRR